MGVNPPSSHPVPLPGDEIYDDHGISNGDSPDGDRQTASQLSPAAESSPAAPPLRDIPIMNQSVLAYLAQQRGAGPVSATSQDGATGGAQPKTTTRSASSQATPAPPSSASSNSSDSGTSSAAPQKPQMPGIGAALLQGLTASAQDFQNTNSAIGGGRPDAEHKTSAAAAPLQWSDLLSPGSVLAPKLAYQIARSWPSTAAGIAGASLGVAAAGGPEDPLALVTGPVGGALGAGMVSGLQSFGNYFGEELHKTPGDPDGAYNRALQRATVAGAFSGAAWAAFPMRAFQGPLKNLMFQAFGAQPAISMAHQATDNALTGKPLTEGLGNAYTQGAIGTAAVAGGHHVAKIAGQYEVQVDPNALGSNLGNVRIVKKPQVVGKPSSEGNVLPDGQSAFKLNRKALPHSEKIEGQPEAQNHKEAAREATAASDIAGHDDVTKAHLGKNAELRLYGTESSGKRSPDVIGETVDGKFRLAEAKGGDTDSAIAQFKAAGRALDPHKEDADVGLDKTRDPVRDKIRSQDLYCSRLGPGYKADSDGFLMKENLDTGAYHLVRPNGKPVRVHIVE